MDTHKDYVPPDQRKQQQPQNADQAIMPQPPLLKTTETEIPYLNGRVNGVARQKVNEYQPIQIAGGGFITTPQGGGWVVPPDAEQDSNVDVGMGETKTKPWKVRLMHPGVKKFMRDGTVVAGIATVVISYMVGVGYGVEGAVSAIVGAVTTGQGADWYITDGARRNGWWQRTKGAALGLASEASFLLRQRLTPGAPSALDIVYAAPVVLLAYEVGKEMWRERREVQEALESAGARK